MARHVREVVASQISLTDPSVLLISYDMGVMSFTLNVYPPLA